jgi:hypothetical protein
MCCAAALGSFTTKARVRSPVLPSCMLSACTAGWGMDFVWPGKQAQHSLCGSLWELRGGGILCGIRHREGILLMEHFDLNARACGVCVCGGGYHLSRGMLVF